MSVEKKRLNLNVNSKTVFLSLLIVIGYLVWDKFNTQARIDAKKEREFTAYANCVSIAENNYVNGWAQACKSNVESSKKELKACKKLADAHATYFSSAYSSYDTLLNYGIAQCEHTYGNSSYNPDCSLPSTQANALNSGLKEAKGVCKDISKTYA